MQEPNNESPGVPEGTEKSIPADLDEAEVRTTETEMSVPVSTPPPSQPSRITPTYQAMHAMRYMRQDIIRKIQEQTDRKLLCYVAGSAAFISRDDTLGFVDLLHKVPRNEDLDLMLTTIGGDMDAAEKLISLVRAKVGNKNLRIVVPDYAKSSGTLMATGADLILMSDSSELGPIDPQIMLNDGHDNVINHSVQCYLDAYTDSVEILRRTPDDAVARIMLSKLEPATIKLFQAALNRARDFAQKQLKRGMLREARGDANWTSVAEKLIDTKRWLSHGQVIGPAEARDIGLVVEYLEPEDPLWQQFWQLYTFQRTSITDKQKLFESDCVSLHMDS